MESKRLGLCNKSLFVVPNHIVEQIASEFLQLYPSANVLVTTKKDFAKNNRKKFCSKIATGDFDAIIIGHSQFEKIPMSVERQRHFLQKQIEEIMDEITGGKGIIFATGTPISNSMVELYTMQRYLQYNTLLKHNLQHFDSWASTFGVIVMVVVNSASCKAND